MSINTQPTELVSFGMARTHRQRGSKRLGFDAIYDLKGVIAAREVQTRLFLEALRGGSQVASSPLVRRKIANMTQAMDAFVARLGSLSAPPQRRTGT